MIPGHDEDPRRRARMIPQVNAVDVIGDKLRPRGRGRLNRQFVGMFLAIRDVAGFDHKVDRADSTARVQSAVERETSVGHRVELRDERRIHDVRVDVGMSPKCRARQPVVRVRGDDELQCVWWVVEESRAHRHDGRGDEHDDEGKGEARHESASAYDAPRSLMSAPPPRESLWRSRP